MPIKPILIYSEYCKYSINFINTLMKHPELFDNFIRMNIDVDPITKSRPSIFYKLQQELNTKITKVPTIITPEQEILSDVYVFKWLEQYINISTDDNDTQFQPFNLNESEVSSVEIADFKEQQKDVVPYDNYSQASQSWGQQIPQNSQISFQPDTQRLKNQNSTDEFAPKSYSQMPSRNQQQRSNSNLSQDRNSNFAQPQAIDFTDSNFGLAGNFSNDNQKSSNSNTSQKSKELDSRLEQMMNDRDITDQQLSQKQRRF